MELSSSQRSDEQAGVTLLPYDSPELLVCAFFGEGLTPDELLAGRITHSMGDGKTVEADSSLFIEVIRADGFWAFRSEDETTIHAWAAGNADREGLTFFLAHEVGLTMLGGPGDELSEEERADTYGATAVLAARWARELIVRGRRNERSAGTTPRGV